MRKSATTLPELKKRVVSLRADLYQRCAAMSVASVESLCRKLHVAEMMILSFKGGKYGE